MLGATVGVVRSPVDASETPWRPGVTPGNVNFSLPGPYDAGVEDGGQRGGSPEKQSKVSLTCPDASTGTYSPVTQNFPYPGGVSSQRPDDTSARPPNAIGS